ncbi:MAG: hypothetical protein LZF62_460004 [Nitrospira sp.]|nr:MAG: hypothetical protein LZF62_460004 [Nitrospira sp.]
MKEFFWDEYYTERFYRFALHMDH